MSKQNHPVPGWFVSGVGFSGLCHYEGVLSMLEANARSAAVNDLGASAMIRSIADRFRDWAKVCEPGWVFSAPAVGLSMVRVATMAPIFHAGSAKPKTEIVGP